MNKNKQKKSRLWVKVILVAIILLLGVFLFIPKGYFDFGAHPRATRIFTIVRLREIDAAILAYKKDNNQLPETLEDLTKLTSTNSPYVAPSDLVDAWGNSYQYAKDQGYEHGFTISTITPEGESINNYE